MMIITGSCILLSVIFLPELVRSQQIRHERTRYMSGRNQLYAIGYSPNENEASENDLSVVHFWKRPLQTFENAMSTPKKTFFRPLFSWDFPESSTSTVTQNKYSTSTVLPIFSSIKSLEASESNDVNYVTTPIKGSNLARRSSMKNISSYRRSYLFLKPSSSIKKNKDGKPKKREEQSNRFESTTRESRRKKKKLIRKNGRRKFLLTTPESSNLRLMGVTRNPEEMRRFENPVPTNTAGIIERTSNSPCELMETKCEQLCRNVNGTAQCVCFKGFAPAGTRCVDINECEVNNGGCNGKCMNTVGSRKCICSAGYRLDNVCTDVNECLLRNGHGPCQDRCVNTPGSYRCNCEGLPGTQLSSDGHTCEQVNGCDPKIQGCSHSCVNFSGRNFCVCPDGYELGNDWKTCRDIDECSNPEDYNVECKSGCFNTAGSYICAEANQTAGTSSDGNSGTGILLE